MSALVKLVGQTIVFCGLSLFLFFVLPGQVGDVGDLPPDRYPPDPSCSPVPAMSSILVPHLSIRCGIAPRTFIWSSVAPIPESFRSGLLSNTASACRIAAMAASLVDVILADFDAEVNRFFLGV